MKTIGLITEHHCAHGRLLTEGIAKFAKERKDWILRPLTAEEVFTKKPKSFDGIIARIKDDDIAQKLLESRRPLVDVFCQNAYPGIGRVDCDHKAVAQLAREFFTQRGFTNLAYCGEPGYEYSRIRQLAFADSRTFVYAKNSRRLPNSHDHPFFDEHLDLLPDGRNLKKWVRSLPPRTAVLCCNDLRAIQLEHVVLSCGLRIPDDIAILGVDNDAIMCSFAEIPLSSIESNARLIGYVAARMLHTIMGKPPQNKIHPIHYVSPGKLIERTSTEIVPVDPPWFGNLLMHIERNKERAIGAREIVDLSGRSSPTVETMFRAKTGMTVQTYITSVKLREAKRLLANPNLRISEIAYRCGFTSQHYFCRLFTATFGMNPRTYKSQISRSGKGHGCHSK